MEENEMNYLERIFKAIPHMSDFEKGRLFGIAEEMERAARSLQKADNSCRADTRVISKGKTGTQNPCQ